MKKYLKFFLALILLLSLSSQGYAMNDIDGHWAKKDIDFLVKEEMVKGYKDGSYRPNKDMTRIEFVILVNSMFPDGISKDLDFKDVKKTNWYYKELAKANNLGYIKGYDDGSFRANNPIKREEAATILHRALGASKGAGQLNFKDRNNISKWAKNSIAYMEEKQYIEGYPNGKFLPKKEINRGEAAKIVARIYREERLPGDFKDISLRKEGKDHGLVISRKSSGPINILQYENKYVIDLLNTRFKEENKFYDFGINSLSRVQVADYKDKKLYPKEDFVTRIVIEFKGTVKESDYDLRRENGNLVFIIRDPNREPDQFEKPDKLKMAIKSKTKTSPERAKAWARARGAHERFIDIADLYFEYGEKTGINPEVLYCQAAKETGYGNYGGNVRPEMNNWAGIKIKNPLADRPEDHESFETPEDGVRGHFNHMGIYCGVDPIGKPHDRWYVTSTISWAGQVLYLEDLSSKWAPSASYGSEIVELVNDLYKY